MQYLPIFLTLQQRACLVVGTTQAAFNKVSLLLRAGAQVTVAAAHLSDQLQALHQTGKIKHYSGVLSPALLGQQTLIIAASEDRNSNRWVYEQAQRCNIPINVVDDPALCSFIMPAIVERGLLTIAISSAGAAPLLTRVLKSRLDTLIPSGYAGLAALAAALRQRVKQCLSDSAQRRRFWERIFDSPLSDQLMALEYDQARVLFEQTLQKNINAKKSLPGSLALIGSGTGAADLLTLRAQQLLQQADSVVYSALVDQQIINRARRDAQCIALKHDDHQALAKQLRTLFDQGQRICWLEPGQPVFCKRIEYILRTLRQVNITIQIIPGIDPANELLNLSSDPRLCIAKHG